MFLSLETLTSIIRTGLSILVALIELVNSAGELCYNFSISNDLIQMVNFPTRISDCDSHSPALLDFFLSSDATICSTMASPPLEILIKLLSRFPLNFHQIHNGMPHSL